METSQVNRVMVEVTRLSTAANEIANLLTAQQKVLSMRGMQLDPEMMSQLVTTQGELARLQASLSEQQPELAQLRALVRTMALISSTLNLDQILNNVVDTFIELTEAERGLIVLIDPITRELDFSVVRGMDADTVNRSNFMVSRTVVEDVANKGEAVIATNALEDARYKAQESIISYNVRSIICVPLKIKEHIIGVAYADHRFRNELFGDKEKQSWAAFANQAAIAIENARLFDDVQKRLSEITEFRNFLDNIFSSIISGIVTLAENGTVLSANRAAEDILGINAATSFGQPYTAIFPSLFEGFEDLLNMVRLQGRSQTLEINPVLPERGPVNLSLKLSPLIDADTQHAQGVVIVIDDLTETKRHNETIRVVNTYLSEEMVSNIQSIDNLGLSGEDREISAVFADVRGFTTFSEQLEPETLMGIINQYLSVAADAIQGYQGVIDKFMGDAVLGLYNTQLNPHTDHAIRAVNAALRMVADVQKLHQQLPPEYRLLYGIAIHSGSATIGNVGSPSRKEFTAIGDAVVQAKKLQECAAGGEIIVSSATYDRIQTAFRCEKVERQLRGETNFKQMYLVLGPK
jgi:adenylate cyclase